ncbi:MAG TPA: hypothetical protein VM934_15540 [Pyrinomonadaceae bacterium]|nr:hypothetical protein [Pyrinomonadaceae bacterium]
MADEKLKDDDKTANQISPETGQFDARFMLWRMFCAESGIPVETLPSDLQGEAKEKWEKMKDRNLHKPAEGK